MGIGAATAGSLARAVERKHYKNMPNIRVRHLSEDVHAALQRKAERRHQSLQQYLAVELQHMAERRSVSEVLDAAEAERGASRPEDSRRRPQRGALGPVTLRPTAAHVFG